MGSPLPFVNDDYNYLINNNELIMTCREALAENEDSFRVIGVTKSPEEPADLKLLSYSSTSSTVSTSLTATTLSKLSTTSSLIASTSISTASTSSTSTASSIGLCGGGSLPLGLLSNSNMDKVSLKEFSKWLTSTEKHLISVCYCSFQPGNVNNQFKKPSKSSTITDTNWIGATAEHKVIQAEIQSVGRRFINSLKANANKIDQSLLTAQEDRWHVLWLKSIEYSMLVEEFHICPNHTTWNRERSSTPHSYSKRFKLGPFSEGKENIKGMMRNRRIQTNMMGIGSGPGLNETFNIPNGKYEIIHKDIGYSSDADMSDACEPNASCPNFINTNAKSPRKRHRRRRPRIGERPWSFHSEWTGWDYYQPPLGFSGEYRSSEDLNSFEDENLVRSLTEFGENYERWFKTDDGILRASEDLASHEEESSSRSLTDSLGTHSDRPLSKASSHHGDSGTGYKYNRSKLLGKKNSFFTSSPNITCSSVTGTETADSLDFTSESATNCGANIEVASALPVVASTFTIKKDARATINSDAHDDDTDADADVITDNLVPFPVLAKAQEKVSGEIENEENTAIAMRTTLKVSPTFILPSPINNYNSSFTQTQQLTTSKSTTTTSTSTKSTPTTSTKYFFIYLTITLLMAVILSILVATLSPISPHVQKTYPNRSPPN